MDEEDLDKLALLDEVFNEVDFSENTENTSCTKTSSPEIFRNSLKTRCPGFLEDIFNLEREALLKKKKKGKSKNEEPYHDSDIMTKVKSLIHEGLTDSSDDEDNKYFEETKYNECGKNIKNLIKQKTNFKNSTSLSEKPNLSENSWADPKKARELVKMQLDEIKKKDVPSNLSLDPIFGMRIINPLVSYNVLNERMVGRKAVGTCSLKKFIDSQAAKDTDWVTGGAIVFNMIRTSQKGNQYCIWNVSDLSGNIKTVCIFLFGSAYKEYSKEALGTVVGILNPIVMNANDRFEATLRVDNAQKIMKLGTSKDYGICKSMKKNGENCTSVVNLAKCDFCTYHMKKEYNKACRRSDLQPPKIGRSIDNLKAKILRKNQVFYGGKTFTGVANKESSKLVQKDHQILKALSKKVTLSQVQTEKDKNTLSRLNGDAVPKVGDVPNNFKTLSISRTPSIPKPTSDNMIDLNFTISKKDRSTAKANALKYIRQHGPLKKPTNDERSKRTTEQILSVKRKLENSVVSQNKKAKVSESELKKDTEKEKLEKHGITEEFLKMMNTDVRNNALLKVAETEEREKYFNKLETREKIEGKMASTFKVECKAVRCLKCNYKSFSASQLCKKEKHPLKVVNAIKRFWKCSNCFSRTVCLELIPLHACKNCGNSKWERASMMPEKKGPNLNVEPLSLRGNEEKFIGAVVKNASLNLLVPEEPS